MPNKLLPSNNKTDTFQEVCGYIYCTSMMETEVFRIPEEKMHQRHATVCRDTSLEACSVHNLTACSRRTPFVPPAIYEVLHQQKTTELRHRAKHLNPEKGFPLREA